MSLGRNETLESIKYSNGALRLLDQRKLPLESVFDEIHSTEDIWKAIREMRVRGAPAIAVSAALGIAVSAREKMAKNEFHAASEVFQYLSSSCDYLMTSRPTAVNLFNTLNKMKSDLVKVQKTVKTVSEAVEAFTKMAEEIYHEDVSFNDGIMRCGSNYILNDAKKNKVNILTICNTGALATSRYGTALGVVRQLFYEDHLEQLYACETRPWNQGSRLTVYECVQENIPCTLICDSAASSLMKSRSIDAVVVGADRICENGDAANKIGTYNLAVVAKHHGVKFYVAAPSSTLDMSTPDGDSVTIEEREAKEMTHDMGTGKQLVASGEHLKVWNPVFDITPGELITGGIITEKGVFTPAKQYPFFSVKKILSS